MTKIQKGSRIKIQQDGKIKQGVVTGTVPTLWGGKALTVRIGAREIAIDAKSIIK